MVPRAYPVGTGWIEVITGCMFSGKTEELIRRLNRARYATQRVVVFKPAVDTRYAVGDVVSHSHDRLPCRPVQHAAEIVREVGDAQVVGIDEAQFFDDELVGVANRLADDGRRVVIAGLDQDYRGRPFEPIPALMAVAEYVTKTLAVCMVCGAPANRSQRLVPRDTRVVLGAGEVYEARCRLHWDPDRFDERQEQLPLAEDGAAGEQPPR
ncbi:MAG: thymidine kinase [Myxococcota bacterium]